MRLVNLVLNKYKSIGAKNVPVDSKMKDPLNKISRSLILSGIFK
jgi:hypothetical protein